MESMKTQNLSFLVAAKSSNLGKKAHKNSSIQSSDLGYGKAVNRTQSLDLCLASLWRRCT
jgi:hypothetical protein